MELCYVSWEILKRKHFWFTLKKKYIGELTNCECEKDKRKWVLSLDTPSTIHYQTNLKLLYLGVCTASICLMTLKCYTSFALCIVGIDLKGLSAVFSWLYISGKIVPKSHVLCNGEPLWYWNTNLYSHYYLLVIV